MINLLLLDGLIFTQISTYTVPLSEKINFISLHL